MNDAATHAVWLIRHGETEWTVSRGHTGLTDLPLTAAGEDQARSLRNCLQGASFERVFCSPPSASHAHLRAIWIRIGS